MAKIAEAFVEIRARTDKLERGLRRAKDRTKASVAAMARMFRTLAIAVAAVVAVIGKIAVSSIRAASKAEQSWSRFRFVMQGVNEEAETFAKLLADNIGRSATDIAEELATFQSFFKGLGITTTDSLALSKVMTQLALDFASFQTGMSDVEGMQRFISALSGSGEVLDRFGINIKQNALDQKLLALGFKKSTAGASEVEKVMARISIIFEAMGQTDGFIGNAALTAGEFDNVLKRLKGTFKDTNVAIGNELLPGATDLLRIIDEILAKILAFGPAIGMMVRAFRIGMLKMRLSLVNLGTSLADNFGTPFMEDMNNILLSFGVDKGTRNSALAAFAGVQATGRASRAQQLKDELAILQGKPLGGGGGNQPLPIQNILDLIRGIVGGGGGGAGSAGGLISSIQTAVGAFKTGQDPTLAVARQQLQQDREQTMLLRKLDANTRDLGPSE